MSGLLILDPSMPKLVPRKELGSWHPSYLVLWRESTPPTQKVAIAVLSQQKSGSPHAAAQNTQVLGCFCDFPEPAGQSKVGTPACI